jgi:arginyl-tRNA synthetase
MSKLLNTQIADWIQRAIEKAQTVGALAAFDIPEIAIERPKVEGRGDYATGVCLGLARLAKKAPLDVARAVIENIEPADYVGKVEANAPGFINITLSEAWLARQVETIVKTGEAWGSADMGHGARVQVEFVSANPTGPLTVGGARNAVLGDALARALQAAGFNVQREYYVNDIGSKVRKMGATLYTHYAQALGVGEPWPDEYYPGQFLTDMGQALAREHGRTYLDMPRKQAIQELGQIGTDRTLQEIRDSLAAMDIHFDAWFSERSLYESGAFDRVFKMLQARGLTVEKDGAIWFAAQEFGHNQDAVIIRSPRVIPNPEDRPTYFASDIAYVWNKLVERGFERAIYVWGADHHGDKPRVLAVAQALGLDPSRVVIILYQLVTLLRSGQEVRMSKSGGEFVTLREVVSEVGADAVRFMLLSSSAGNKINFDLDLAVKQSSENPVYYVQYAHARICSILRKAADEGWRADRETGRQGDKEIEYAADLSLLNTPGDLALIRKMLELPEVIAKCAQELSPHYLPHYAQDLAATFHAFYRDCRVISSLPEETELTRARLQLVQAAKIVLARTLHLMGMNAPESM